MAGAPTPIPTLQPTESKPTWGDVFKDKALIVTLIVTFQFFFLVILFSQRPSQMAVEAKGIILQTYVVAFTACWSFFLRGVVDAKLAALPVPPALHTEPAGHVIQQP
jgi:hypothetical protein